MVYLQKNRFGINRSADFKPGEEVIVFISYKCSSDLQLALECAETLESVGASCWIDQEDECIKRAQSEESDIEIANCIEKGLDDASALLGIIGPETFKSSWVPYEIGGARGRQRFKRFISADSQSISRPIPHPLIAHFLHSDVDLKRVPEYVSLGTPLVSCTELSWWAKSILEILKEIETGWKHTITFENAQVIRESHGIEAIYDENIRDLGTLYDTVDTDEDGNTLLHTKIDGST